MSKTKIQMQRRGHALHLTSPVWADILEAFPERCDLNVSITRARSIRQNGTYWGLLQFVIDHGPESISAKWPDKDQLSDALQLETGYVKQISLGSGLLYGVPEHKNFDDMAQEKFNRYFNAAMAKLIQWCNYDPLPLYKQYLADKHGSSMGRAA